MPAISKSQRRAMSIAEHEPGKLFKRNRGLLKMDKGDLHDFASTKEKGLPERITGSRVSRKDAERATRKRK